MKIGLFVLSFAVLGIADEFSSDNVLQLLKVLQVELPNKPNSDHKLDDKKHIFAYHAGPHIKTFQNLQHPEVYELPHPVPAGDFHKKQQKRHVKYAKPEYVHYTNVKCKHYEPQHHHEHHEPQHHHEHHEPDYHYKPDGQHYDHDHHKPDFHHETYYEHHLKPHHHGYKRKEYTLEY